MKLYFIAGEASGDLHGSNLIKQLKQKSSSIECRGWGGDLMQNAGMHLVKHIEELAFMGFTEVVANLSTILSNFKQCKQDILSFQPDAVVLIDYPGFNLRMAEFCKKNGIKVFYYISPQIWAWKKNRVFKIKKYVDEMFVILPFEKQFYADYNFNVHYVGHPLLDAISQFKKQKPNSSFSAEKPIIALLPGSRSQEISVMLPVMLNATKRFSDYQIIIAGAPTKDENFYQSFLQNYPNVSIVFNKTYELLSQATTALVTSGTATLETALFQVPQVVCYKGGKISYHIAKRLIKVNYISLVNLILNKEAVKELIQNDFNEKKLKEELLAILPNGDKRKSVLENYQQLIKLLGKGGASENVANLMLKTLTKASA
ncbi:MAG: lipid-A-disaccharide synthase [Bacteroidia bacterium]